MIFYLILTGFISFIAGMAFTLLLFREEFFGHRDWRRHND